MGKRTSINTFVVLASVAVLFCSIVSHSAWADVCDWDIEVLDGMSREVRHYRPGTSWVTIDIADLNGYTECRITPVKEFEFHGVPASRIEIYCFTKSGEVFQNSCVALIGTPGVTIFQLLSKPVKIINPRSTYSIDAGGYKEFTLQCK
jgi:hypothetical protein